MDTAGYDFCKYLAEKENACLHKIVLSGTILKGCFLNIDENQLCLIVSINDGHSSIEIVQKHVHTTKIPIIVFNDNNLVKRRAKIIISKKRNSNFPYFSQKSIRLSINKKYNNDRLKEKLLDAILDISSSSNLLIKDIQRTINRKVI